MTLYYVVSDVWMGRALHDADSPQVAERNQYLETLASQGYDEESDQTEVRLEQFRAWPVETWPHDLEFEEAFHWIGKQKGRTVHWLADVDALTVSCGERRPTERFTLDRKLVTCPDCQAILENEDAL